MKNWTVKEAAQVIRENKDAEAIKEIVKHFPLFAVIVAGRDFDGLTDAMPEHLTVRKIENELNNGTAGVEDADADVDDEVEDTEDSEKALEDMTKNELIALCEKKGLKVQKHQRPKQYYIDALNGADDEEPEKAAADDDEEEEEDDPVALYKKCKKAGLKVAPKKSAKYYKDQLAKTAEAEQSDDADDDWDDEDGDEEEVEEKPKKPTKKAPAKKASKKPAKKEQPEEEEEDDEDDDDEWDI